MNTDEMLKDKNQLARMIAFELCPQRYHKDLYGEESMCYSDNNFSDCIKIKEVVDKIYDAGYEKIREDEFILNQSEIDELRKDQAEIKFLKDRIKQETAREILALIGKPNYKGDDWYEGAFCKQEQIREQIADNYGIELEDENND